MNASIVVPKRQRTSIRIPATQRKLGKLAQVAHNNINEHVICPDGCPSNYILNNSKSIEYTELLKFMRLVDTMHDLTERESIAKKLEIKSTTLSNNVLQIYGQDMQNEYKDFATSVMKLEPKEYNNIKVIKARLYNYITKIAPTQFNIGGAGRRVEFKFNTPISNNRLSNLTPMMVSQMMNLINDSRFVVDATKYSLNTNIRLNAVKQSDKQLLTFAQLIDPSTISNSFNKYLFEIPRDGTKVKSGDFLFVHIYTFTEMYNDFDYYYIMEEAIYNKLKNMGYAIFLDKDYKNTFAIVCFRKNKNKHYPFLNAYLLNSQILQSIPNIDQFVLNAYNVIYNRVLPTIRQLTNFNVYKTTTFTKGKLSIDKLVDMAAISRDPGYNLHIALDYKRSFDSLQMDYQAYLNVTPVTQKFNNIQVNDDTKYYWDLFHKSTIISFDILSGLFGFLFGANVMIEYRGTYRMFGIDQSTKMRHIAFKKETRRNTIEQFKKLSSRLQPNILNNLHNTNVKRYLNNNDQEVIRRARNFHEQIHHRKVNLNSEKVHTNINAYLMALTSINKKINNGLKRNNH